MKRTYEVRRYRHFPIKEPKDKIMKKYEDLIEAQHESMRLNRTEYEGFRYYVIEFPHEIKELSNLQRYLLKTKFGLV